MERQDRAAWLALYTLYKPEIAVRALKREPLEPEQTDDDRIRDFLEATPFWTPVAPATPPEILHKMGGSGPVPPQPAPQSPFTVPAGMGMNAINGRTPGGR